jgi:hypothetical protein
MQDNNASILDVISYSAQRDTIVVLPTLRHAIHWWPIIIQAGKDTHKHCTNTRTAVIFQDTHTIIRLWVPYARQPTMPMDYPADRRNKEVLNLYGLYRGGLL